MPGFVLERIRHTGTAVHDSAKTISVRITVETSLVQLFRLARSSSSLLAIGILENATQLWIGPLGDLSTHEHKNKVLETD